jgi:hypothetical protein
MKKGVVQENFLSGVELLGNSRKSIGKSRIVGYKIGAGANLHLHRMNIGRGMVLPIFVGLM